MQNASDDFPQQKKLENLLPNFAGSSPPISPKKTSSTSLWKSLVRGQKINANFFCIKFFDNPSGHGRPRRKSWTSAPKSAFSCGPDGGEKLFDLGASGHKGQERPREIRTKKSVFMLLFLPSLTFSGICGSEDLCGKDIHYIYGIGARVHLNMLGVFTLALQLLPTWCFMLMPSNLAGICWCLEF